MTAEAKVARRKLSLLQLAVELATKRSADPHARPDPLSIAMSLRALRRLPLAVFDFNPPRV